MLLSEAIQKATYRRQPQVSLRERVPVVSRRSVLIRDAIIAVLMLALVALWLSGCDVKFDRGDLCQRTCAPNPVQSHNQTTGECVCQGAS